MSAEPTRHPVPQADRHLLALHALTGRQLRTALLHGSRRSWRDRRRMWPAVLTAAAIIGLLIAVLCVLAAFDRQRQLESGAAGTSFSATTGPGQSADDGRYPTGQPQ